MNNSGFNAETVLNALEISGWGYLGIFAVTAVIIGCIYLFNKVFTLKKEDIKAFTSKFKKAKVDEIDLNDEE